METKDASTVVVVTVGSLCMLVGLVAMVWFYRRRRRQPIKVRVPWTAMASSVLCMQWIVGHMLVSAYHGSFPCVAFYWLSLSGPFAAVIYLARVWIFYYAYRAAQEQMAMLEERKDKGWFLKHRFLASNRFILALWLAIMFVQTLPIILVTVSHDGLMDGSAVVAPGVECPGKMVDSMNFLFWMAMAAVVAVFAAWKLRLVIDDVFYLKHEFFVAGITAVVTSLPGTVFSAVLSGYDDFNMEQFDFNNLLACVAGFGIIAVSIIFPLAKSYSREFVVTVRGRRNSVSGSRQATSFRKGTAAVTQGVFREMLALPDFYQIMRAHLAKEFSLENLLFVECVDFFRSQFLITGAPSPTHARQPFVAAPTPISTPPPHRNSVSHISDSDTSSSISHPLSVSSSESTSISEGAAAALAHAQRSQTLQDAIICSSEGVSPSIHKLIDGHDIITAAYNVYKEFVAPGAPLQINLSSPVFSRLSNALNAARMQSMGASASILPSNGDMEAGKGHSVRLKRSLFKEAQEEILRLMSEDTFARLLQTKEYRDMIQVRRAVESKEDIMTQLSVL